MFGKSEIFKIDKWVSETNLKDARYVLAASVSLNLFALALPLALLQVYDRIIPNSSYGTLFLLVVGVGSIVLLEALMRVARADIISWMGAQIEHRAGCKAFARLMEAPADDLEQAGAGDLIERFSGLPMVREIFTEHWTLLVCDLPFAVIFLATIWYLAGWLVLAPLALIGLIVFIAVKGSPGAEKAVEDFNKIRDHRQNFTIEAIHGIHSIKSMALETQMIQRLARLQETVATRLHKLVLSNASVLSNGSTFSQLSTLSLVVLGAFMVVDNQLTIGGLSACTLLTGRALQPIQKAVAMWSRFQNAQLLRARFESLLDLPSEHAEGATPLKIEKGGIELRNVSLHYDPQAPILRNVSLKFEPGAKVAIAGDNGSGKSSLLRLIFGSMRPTEGLVLVDGQPIADFDRNAQKSGGIAYVPQRGELFKGTILDNLTMFRPSLRHEALRIAGELGLDDVIYRLPQGYHTRVGDGSTEALPRGVAQRIAVVRALTRKPKVLLFDEANTAMDNQGDERLRAYLEKMDRGTTLIMVTLRPSLQKLADSVLQLEKGRLVPAPPRQAPPQPAVQPPTAANQPVGLRGAAS